MNNILCNLKGFWRSIPQILNGSYPISGHLFVDVEEHKNCTVIISECETCGETHINWSSPN